MGIKRSEERREEKKVEGKKVKASALCA